MKIICLIFLGVLGLLTFITGIESSKEGDVGGSIIGISLGTLFLSITIVYSILTPFISKNLNTEDNIKIIGKGITNKSTIIEYYSGRKDNINENIYFVITENNEKIIVNKPEWENTKGDILTQK